MISKKLKKKFFMKLLVNLGSLAAVIMLLAACGEVEVPNKYFEMDGERYELGIGQIYDRGTDADITYRNYDLGFATSASNPRNYISFELFSNSTTRIEEGSYTYKYWAEKGEISSIVIGTGISYDNSGEAIAGTRYSESNSDFEGTVTVSKKNDNYSFVFDITITRDSESHTITGEFNEVLSEGYFNY